MKEKITCEISVLDFIEVPRGRIIQRLTPQRWENIVTKKLKKAGIPLDECGNLLSGEIRRFDDPKDFGKTIYEWRE